MAAELISALVQYYPNGLSLNPTTLRLLRKKVQIEDYQIENLKTEMFQLRNGRWYFRQMILDDKSLLRFKEKANEWLGQYGCFAIKRLFDDFQSVLNNIAALEDFAIFLKYLCYAVVVCEQGVLFCYSPSSYLNDWLRKISIVILKRIEDASSILPLAEIQQELPNLTEDALECVRMEYLPNICVANIGGATCWCSTEAIPLPQDFAEKLTTVVNTLIEIEEKVNIKNIELGLNLFYRTRVREECALQDDYTFIKICDTNYKDKDSLLSIINKNKNNLKSSRRRVRSSNTRFCNLGVPVGAKLTFIKDSSISCVVINDINRVEYNGKEWSISALAKHLSDVRTTNGFAHFSYEGETLQERRSRLERDNKQDEDITDEMQPLDNVQVVKGKGIRLEGQKLLSKSWREFRRGVPNPCVVDWVRRLDKGERMERIACESGYDVSDIEKMVSYYHLFFKVQKINNFVPETDSNV